MFRIAWLTDIHLNFLRDEQVDEFLAQVKQTAADCYLVSGDIGEAPTVARYLRELRETLDRPIYFVLGNHDYYRGSILQVRQEIESLCSDCDELIYLTDKPHASLLPQLGIVGHDGWADGRLGDYLNSRVRMADFELIEELRVDDRLKRWEVLKQLADQGAAALAGALPKALQQHRTVMLLTHVPPLREACWYNGRVSDDSWAPHFTCKAIGDVILDVMKQYPEHRLLVLCGHTHGRGECRPLPNVEILTGGAEYWAPEVQRVFSF